VSHETTQSSGADGSAPSDSTAAPTELAAESDNVVRELVEYVRSNTVRNEQQFILGALSYLTGYMADTSHFNSATFIGTSSSGKSHVKGKLEALFPPDHLYEMSSGTEKSAIYDDEWDTHYIVCMQELQQPPEDFIEFLKSAHGGDEVFEYKTTRGSVQDGFYTETITKEAKPYFFTSAQFSPDFEMWNRLLKIPVHESESKNRAVGAMAFDHERISVDDDVEYIYPYADGARKLQAHIASIPEQTTGRVLIPSGGDEYAWDVWDVIRPIFNHERSEANRIYSMVANLIRSSALLNYHTRETRTLTRDGDTHEWIVAQPQDVANVLRCREALLATTHEIDRKKRASCNAIDERGGDYREVEGIKPIREYISESDAPMVKESEMANILADLQENYLIRIHEDAGDRSDIYEFFGWDALGFAKVDEYADRFTGCIDPITGQSFVHAHEELREELATDAQDLLKQASDNSTRSPGGASTSGAGSGQTVRADSGPALDSFGAGGDTLEVDLGPVEEAVYEYVRPILDGERVENLDDVPVEALIGLVPLSEPDRRVSDRTGTLLDPDRDVWDQPDRADDWVIDESGARREIKHAVTRLIENGVVQFDEIHKLNETGEPVDATLTVREV